LKVKIFRYDASSQPAGCFQEYDVPTVAAQRWTVMDILDYISLNLDSSLAYFRHSSCNQGSCARCSLKVNGKPVLACVLVPEDDEITLEPATNQIVRDLIIKQ
jgi:succinate dehydrogenase / fumarate reductase, iron-sulfur subunit